MSSLAVIFSFLGSFTHPMEEVFMTGKKIFAVLSCFALFGSANFGWTAEEAVKEELKMTKDEFADIDAIVDEALAAFDAPGVAVAIVKDGNLLMAKGYGLRDQEKNLPVTENTVFAIGSCTKAFTSFVLGQLVDEGLISWDDLVIQHLPEFRVSDQYTTTHITIRDLIAHRSGIAGHDLIWYNSDLATKDFLPRLQYLEPACSFREKFQYNNLMYVTAGLIVEKVTNKSWEENVKERILKPLGMDQANFSVKDSQKNADFASPYIEMGGKVSLIPFRDISNVGPAGSINTSALDMTRWLKLQLAGGVYEGKALVRPETLQAMHTPQIALPCNPQEDVYDFAYGMGWILGIYKGRYSIWHNGGIDGFLSHMAFLPQEGIGVVVLTNSSSSWGLAPAIVNGIYDHLLGEEKGEWLAKSKALNEQYRALQKKSAETSRAATKSDRPADDYVLEFEHPGYGVMKVLCEDGALIASYNNIKMPLTHKCYDIFEGSLETVQDRIFTYSFLNNFSGEIAELQIALDPTIAPIAFKRRASSELFAKEYLQKFEGMFENAEAAIEVILKGKALTAVVSGQSFELIPEKQGSFSLKGYQGFKANFVKDADGKMAELVFVQPNGTFSYKAK